MLIRKAFQIGCQTASEKYATNYGGLGGAIAGPIGAAIGAEEGRGWPAAFGSLGGAMAGSMLGSIPGALMGNPGLAVGLSQLGGHVGSGLGGHYYGALPEDQDVMRQKYLGGEKPKKSKKGK